MTELFKNIRNRKIDMVNIQVTSKCNYTCGMCPFHGEGYSGEYFKERPTAKREVTINELKETLEKLVVAGVEKIDLTPNGEFFSHNNWQDVLKTIKQFGLKIVTTTNGGLLTEEKIKEICGIGIDQVTVSIDSIDYERYKEIRKPATLNAFNNAINAPIFFKKYGGENIYVQIQVTDQPEYPQEAQKVLEYYKNYTFNQITVNKMFSTTENGIEYYNTDSSASYVHGKCKVYGSPIIMPDGKVLPCCGAFYFYPQLGDKIPNIKDFSLQETTAKLDDLYEKNKTFINYCKNCSLYEIDNNNETTTKCIEGHYFLVQTSVKKRYFKIPYGLHHLPKSIILWLYKKGYISKLKYLVKGS